MHLNRLRLIGERRFEPLLAETAAGTDDVADDVDGQDLIRFAHVTLHLRPTPYLALMMVRRKRGGRKGVCSRPYLRLFLKLPGQTLWLGATALGAICSASYRGLPTSPVRRRFFFFYSASFPAYPDFVCPPLLLGRSAMRKAFSILAVVTALSVTTAKAADMRRSGLLCRAGQSSAILVGAKSSNCGFGNTDFQIR